MKLTLNDDALVLFCAERAEGKDVQKNAAASEKELGKQNLSRERKTD